MKIKVLTDEKVRLDKYLTMHTEYHRSLIQKLIVNECVFVNGVLETSSSRKVKNEDEIEIQEEFQEESFLQPEDIPLDIVFENENVIVINKKSGMVVHPGSGNKKNTLVNALLFHTKNLSDCNGEIRPGIVHRIDKDTSGLLLVAKNNEAHRILAEDLKNKKISRKYIALVCGILKHNHITIDAPIGRDEKNRLRMCVTSKNSKNAVTHVHVLKRFSKYTLVECVLDTGRTHQIRVHLSYIGYPLFNDPVYGKEVIKGFGQFLHSSEITFLEPITKEELHFEAPLPFEFQDFLNRLEKDKEQEIEK